MKLKGHLNRIFYADFLNDNHLISGANDYTLKIWNFSEIALFLKLKKLIKNLVGSATEDEGGIETD
jgi:hypothetical protein